MLRRISAAGAAREAKSGLICCREDVIQVDRAAPQRQALGYRDEQSGVAASDRESLLHIADSPHLLTPSLELRASPMGDADDLPDWEATTFESCDESNRESVAPEGVTKDLL